MNFLMVLYRIYKQTNVSKDTLLDAYVGSSYF